MERFTKSDLKFSYNWNGKINPKEKIRFYDTYELNTDDGDEVLQFINCYMSLKNYSMLCTFHKIEKAIKLELPKTKNGYNKVKRWLNENYFF